MASSQLDATVGPETKDLRAVAELMSRSPIDYCDSRVSARVGFPFKWKVTVLIGTNSMETRGMETRRNFAIDSSCE